MKRLRSLLILLLVLVLSVPLLFGSLLSQELYKTEASFISTIAEHLRKEGASYISEEITASFPFHALAARFQHNPVDLALSVRYKDGGTWTDWISVPMDQDTSTEGQWYSSLVFTELTSTFQYKLDSYGTTTPQGIIDFSYYNALNKEVSVDFTKPAAQVLAAVLQGNVVSREGWGADPNLLTVSGWNAERAKICERQPWYCTSDPAAEERLRKQSEEHRKNFPEDTAIENTVRYANGNELYWPVQNSQRIKKLVVHHTAETNKDTNGDGVYNLEDEKASLRATYYFHTITRGWGDIGYNYLVGPSGTVYEGRFGGPKAVAAHAQWRNVSSIGISVMGNFQEKDIPNAQLQGLIGILTREANRFNINALGSGMFYGKNQPNILGHRDVGATACPGEFLYNKLPTIRNTVAQGTVVVGGDTYTPPRDTEDFGGGSDMVLNSASPEYTAEYTSTAKSVRLQPGETRTITMAFRNKGKNRWGNETYLHVNQNDNPLVRVVPARNNERGIAAIMPKSPVTVAPDASVEFTVTIEAGMRPTKRQFQFSPMINGTRMIESVFIDVEVVQGDFSYAFVSVSNASEPLTFGEKRTIEVRLRNTGSITWQRDGASSIVLRTDNPRGRESIYMATDKAVLGKLKEESVRPGQTGTFLVNVVAPRQVSASQEFFTPSIGGYGFLNNNNLYVPVQVVDPSTKITLKTKKGTQERIPSLGGGARHTAHFEIINDSHEVWRGLQGMPVALNGTSANGTKIDMFGAFVDDVVAVGSAGKVAFTFNAPLPQGTYTFTLRPRINGKDVFTSPTLSFRYTVQAPVARASIESKRLPLTNISLKGEQELEYKVKNTGNITWTREATALGIFSNRRDPHPLYHPSWENSLRPGRLLEERVAPGEVGTFRFLVQGNTTGYFAEDFKIGITGIGWVTMPTLDIRIWVRGTATTTPKPSTPTTPTDTNNIPEPPKTPTPTTPTTPSTSTATPTSTNNHVRVRLSVDLAEVRLQSWNGGYNVFVDGTHVGTYDKNTPATIKANSTNVTFQNAKIDSRNGAVIRFEPVIKDDVTEITNFTRYPAWDTNKQWNDNVFKGIIEVRRNPDNGRLWVINDIHLDDYMRGIAEVPGTDPVEKQKALAILSRTYVMHYMDPANVKFPGKPFQGSDDPNEFQKYLGHRFTMRAAYWVQAVAATQGEVVTYQGKLIKTPYFSESDGRTRSAQEVWGWTDTPYLKSVSDTHCKNGQGKLWGHGVGLSGCGATGMAAAGRTYRQIIQYYYSGVEIGKI